MTIPDAADRFFDRYCPGPIEIVGAGIMRALDYSIEHSGRLAVVAVGLWLIILAYGLTGCATLPPQQEPAPSECSAGVCIIQSLSKHIRRVCLIVIGSAVPDCWDPYTRTAWVSNPGNISDGICLVSYDPETCKRELFYGGEK